MIISYGNLGNVTIVNGRVINEEAFKDSYSKEFDETKNESTNGINRISIISDVNVKVSACNTNDVIAHLHGLAITDSDLKLSMTKIGDEIRVCVKSEVTSVRSSNVSMISGSSVVINNCIISGDSGLILDVQIPTKSFEKLYIESKNANVDVKSSVNANTITVDNKNGNIDLSAIFQTLNIDCKNGNVDIDSEACCDVSLNVSSKNGNIDVTIGNIGISKLSVNSKNGGCKNNPRLKGIYKVCGYITSKNGNVRFR